MDSLWATVLSMDAICCAIVVLDKSKSLCSGQMKKSLHEINFMVTQGRFEQSRLGSR
jgi:hypothetical protein